MQIGSNRLLRHALWCAVGLTMACTHQHTVEPVRSAPVQASEVERKPATTPFETTEPRQRSFADWKDAFRAKALAAGIKAESFDRIFSAMSPDPSILSADHRQPEFIRPVWEYLDGAVSSARIDQGRRKSAEHAQLLKRIESLYPVTPSILVAIWGMESSYGQHIGNKNVLRSLATLAYQGRRQAFAEEQLLSALQIMQTDGISSERMIGSWAGAMGQTQFIPTTFQRYAVDFDNDGKRDLWRSVPDTLASAAHYLQASGWQPGLTWGMEVRLPAGFDYARAELDILEPIEQWRLWGVTRSDGARLEGLGETASLLLPAGHQGPAFLVTANFMTIMKYNHSTAYALAIGLLSDALQQGGTHLSAHWPTHQRPLSRDERLLMQQRLAVKGFSPGTIDGVIGINSRKAIRAYQQSQRLPADGYPTAELLDRLRRE